MWPFNTAQDDFYRTDRFQTEEDSLMYKGATVTVLLLGHTNNLFVALGSYLSPQSDTKSPRQDGPRGPIQPEVPNPQHAPVRVAHSDISQGSSANVKVDSKPLEIQRVSAVRQVL